MSSNQLLDGTLAVQSGTNPIHTHLQCVANRGRIPNVLGSAASASQVCADVRRRYQTGNAALSELRLIYANFYVDGAGVVAAPAGMEYGSGSAYTLETAIEIVGAPNPVVRATIAGASTASVPDGTAELLTDPVYPSQFGLTSFPPNTVFFVRERRVISVGGKFARHPAANSPIAGEAGYLSDGASASQVANSGALSVPSGSTNVGPCFAPVLVVGRAVQA